MILQSVHGTRSRRRDFCVQMGFGVCTNKHPLAKWIARGIACWYNVIDEIKISFITDGYMVVPISET